jgi:hypothetical protein
VTQIRRDLIASATARASNLYNSRINFCLYRSIGLDEQLPLKLIM